MGGLLLLFIYAYLLDLSRSGNNTSSGGVANHDGTERLYKMGFNYLEHPPPSSPGCNSCRSRTFSCRGGDAVDPAQSAWISVYSWNFKCRCFRSCLLGNYPREWEDAVHSCKRCHNQQPLPNNDGSVCLLPPCYRSNPAHLPDPGSFTRGDGACRCCAFFPFHRRDDVPSVLC